MLSVPVLGVHLLVTAVRWCSSSQTGSAAAARSSCRSSARCCCCWFSAWSTS